MKDSEAIQIALRVYKTHPGWSEEDLETAFVDAGIPQQLAYLVVEFVPLAFGRIILRQMRVTVWEEYVRYVIDDGKVIEKERKKLADEPFFVTASRIARSKRGWWKVSDEFRIVAAKSTELQAVVELVERGSRAENIVLTPPQLQFRDENDSAHQ